MALRQELEQYKQRCSLLEKENAELAKSKAELARLGNLQVNLGGAE